MSDDELTRPLGLNRLEKGNSFAAIIGGILIFLLFGGAGLWILLVNDPLGGEPGAVLSLEAPAEQAGLAEGQESAEDERSETARGPDYSLIEAAGLNDTSLSQTPDPRVTEAGETGPLPTISDMGIRPLDLYARPIAPNLAEFPKIAIVIGGLGLSQTRTQQIIEKLPADVTLAFNSYGSSLNRWVRRARENGHELLLEIPLEPYGYPQSDPGPDTLLVEGDMATINEQRFTNILGRITNYVGVINQAGSRFITEPEAMRPLLEKVKQRGLMFVDDGNTPRSVAGKIANDLGMVFVKSNIVIDQSPTAEDISVRLSQAEDMARLNGFAVVSASALPITIDQLDQWIDGLEARGVVLVPVTALTNVPAL